MDAADQDLLDLLGHAPVVEHGEEQMAIVADGRHGQDDCDEEDALMALLPAPRRRKFEQRSDSLCAHARAARTKKVHARQLDEERKRRRSTEMALKVVSQGDRQMQGILPSAMRNSSLPADVKAATLVHLACVPIVRARTRRSTRHAQQEAVAIVAQSLLNWAHRYWGEATQQTRAAMTPDGSLAVGPTRTVMFSMQWDEASQKFKAMTNKLANGEKITVAKLAHQVMVFSSRISTRGVFDAPTEEIIAGRSMALEETSANFILEGLLQQLPLQADARSLSQIASRVTNFVLLAVCDRASANQLAMAWLFKEVQNSHSNVLPWVEFCWCHGVSLAKNRAKMVKRVGAALRSFTTWLKSHRNTQALRKEIRVVVSRSFEVQYCAPPAYISEVGRTLVARLYAHDSHALWRMDPTTRTVEPTPWKLDLDEFCQHATFSDRGPRWRHYCYVTPGSQAHKDGKRVGARCCSSRAESADRTASVICSVVTGRTWKLACESRFPLGSKQQGSQRPILQFQIWNLHMRVPSIYVCSHLRVSESTLLSATSQLNLQVGQPAGEPARFGRAGRAGRPARPARPDRPARGHILGNP